MKDQWAIVKSHIGIVLCHLELGHGPELDKYYEHTSDIDQSQLCGNINCPAHPFVDVKNWIWNPARYHTLVMWIL